jgi:hypothetical protein
VAASSRLNRAGLACLLLAALGACAGWAAASAPATAPAHARAAAAAGAGSQHRLGLIVAPARIRPGRSAIVHVVDTSGRGGVSARLCARSGALSGGCRDVRLTAGRPRLRTHVRLPRAGRWTVALRRAQETTPLRRSVLVAPTARYRVLVTGDSMVYGIIDVLERGVRRSGGVLTGDPHPGSGITKPFLLKWPQHARESARRLGPDATVVFLGAAVDTFPLVVGGEPVQCCGPAWVGEYVRQLREMMASYLRGGSALVYWCLLPAPRDADRVASHHAINGAIRQAAATFPDGVRTVDVGRVISPGDVYRETAMYRGERKVIREPDGIHLANAGIHLATEYLERVMRRDGIVR